MKKHVLFLFGIAIFLCFPVRQTNLLAENNYRGVKAGVGAAVTAGALVSWWHFGKELKKTDKLQKVVEKMKVVDPTHTPRVKKLMMYRYISLFVALLSCGYSVKQVAGWVKEIVNEEREKKTTARSR